MSEHAQEDGDAITQDLAADIYNLLEDAPTDHIVTVSATQELTDHIASGLMRAGWRKVVQ